MLFAILCDDKPGSLDLRLSTRPEHVAFLTGLGTVLKFAGPFLDGEEKPCGSMLVVEAESLDAAKAIAAEDPYAKAGLFAQTSVRAWRWTINNPEAA
ncbi:MULTISPECIES: YciI-like protein [unclassified Aureimonas]|uniref:YciI-like protein n=1 Tax=unclassified Aureimonas TaxID=2615206 RepID=UPI0006F8CC8A|nr:MULTISPECIES: YciI-like protein [unclassified Aureimonas]KQT61847.1 hypothetical protein ASG62_23770 [Aureimonas sp. Leaf427]KQT74879.1 hypothetical protein ASG54_03510 [Aureimonas sp. Leaf460]